MIDDSVYKEILLSGNACEKLGLLAIENAVSTESKYAKLLDQHANIFSALGKAKTVYSARLKSNITPVIKPSRRVPQALMEPLKKELNSMVNMGVFEPVTEPTEWVNPLVVAFKKNDKLRVCLDPKDLNEALCREHYPLPVFEDITYNVHGARVFSKLDLKAAFWQIPVDEPTSKLFCFATPFGRYKFLRLPFGITPASEVCHRWNAQVLQDLPFVKVNVDDILIYSRNHNEHVKHLELLFNRLYENNLTLNRDKCVFGVPEVTFLGYHLSAEGIRPQDVKFDSINKLAEPHNVSSLKTFLGIVNFLKDFVPSIADELAPLYNLLRSDTAFVFDENCRKAFNRIKAYLTTEPVLRHFDPSRRIKIITDASRVGVGAVLLQSHDNVWHPVKYVSRKLTSAESKWAAIEQELLAVLFALERLRVYVWGTRLLVETDHKPLLGIHKKEIHDLSPRLQRMRLKLMKYDYDIQHIPGCSNVIADVLSRSGISDEGSVNMKLDGIERQVLSTVISKPFSSSKLSELALISENDDELCLIKHYVTHGWPENSKCDPIAKPYWNIRYDLSISRNILLYRDALVVPKAMRADILDRIHDGHLGQTKCLERARGSVYWPGITNQIKQKVASCSSCQAYQKKCNAEPLLEHERPEQPWPKIGVDIFYWNGNDYLLAADYASGFPELVRLQGKDSSAIIVAFKMLSSRYGIPLVVISDNEPRLTSFEVKEFNKNWGVTLLTSSPYHPKSNGLAERSIQTVKISLKKSLAANDDPFLALLTFRGSPNSSGESPAGIFFRRDIRTTLSKFKEEINLDSLTFNRRDCSAKFRIGDLVNVYDHRAKCFNKQGVVKSIDAPRSVTVDTGDRSIRRNQQLIRQSHGPLPTSSNETSDLYDLSSPCKEEEWKPELTPVEVITVPSPPDKVPPQLIEKQVTTRSGRQVQKPARYR